VTITTANQPFIHSVLHEFTVSLVVHWVIYSSWIWSAVTHLWQVSGFTNDILLLILGLGSVYKSAWNHHPCTIPPRTKGKLRNDLSIKVVYTSQSRTYGWCKGKMEHDLRKFNISAGILYLNSSYWHVQIFYINHENPACGDLTLRRLMSYIYGAPILDVSRSHTMTQHSR